MNLLKKIFGIGSNKPSQEAKSWTDTNFTSKSMRQIVIEVKSPIWKTSRFKHLALPYDKYHTILQNPVSTGFVKMASEQTPILLIRANDLSGALKTTWLKVAFSFFTTEKGGVLVVFIEPQGDRIVIGLNYSHIEMVYGLDNDETVNRIREGWKNGYLDLVLADKSDSMTHINVANKSSMSSPEAKWDCRLLLEPECVVALNAALSSYYKINECLQG